MQEYGTLVDAATSTICSLSLSLCCNTYLYLMSTKIFQLVANQLELGWLLECDHNCFCFGLQLSIKSVANVLGASCIDWLHVLFQERSQLLLQACIVSEMAGMHIEPCLLVHARNEEAGIRISC
jgi:hypothetical protein